MFTPGRTSSMLRRAISPFERKRPASTEPPKRSIVNSESAHTGSAARASASRPSKAFDTTVSESTSTRSTGNEGSNESSTRLTLTRASSALLAYFCTIGVRYWGFSTFTAHISAAPTASTSAMSSIDKVNMIFTMIRRIAVVCQGAVAVMWKQACLRSCFTRHRPSERKSNIISASRFLRSSKVRLVSAGLSHINLL